MLHSIARAVASCGPPLAGFEVFVIKPKNPFQAGKSFYAGDLLRASFASLAFPQATEEMMDNSMSDHDEARVDELIAAFTAR